MQSTKQISQHLHQVFFGGNWTWVNVKETLANVSFETANKRIGTCNTIGLLTFHIHYYVKAILAVLQQQPFNFHDKYSFDMPAITNEEDWQQMQANCFTNVQTLCKLIEDLPDETLPTIFVEEKYGSYHRNFLGLIEHTHYHLGQISLLKKIAKK